MKFKPVPDLPDRYDAIEEGVRIGSVWNDEQGWHARCDCGMALAVYTNASPTRHGAAVMLSVHRATHEKGIRSHEKSDRQTH